MESITIEHNVTPAKLDVLYVDDWPVWEKGISEFDWSYDKKETCYIVEGKAIVTPEDGEPVTITEGDMVFFYLSKDICRIEATHKIHGYRYRQQD